MLELSPTWVVITIGNRKYAINSIYIQSIVKLSTAMFKVPYYSNGFIKGVYDIHGATITILDGRKIINERTIDECKIQCANKINSIRCKHESWIDAVESELITGKELSKEADDSDLKEFLISSEYNYDDHINVIISKMKQPYEIVHALAIKALSSKREGRSIDEINSLMREIRRQSNNYIIKNLEKILEVQTSKFNELCIIIKLHELVFGVSIDKIEMITEQVENLSNYAKTMLSAGNVDIKGINYNILNLTKLAKVVK